MWVGLGLLCGCVGVLICCRVLLFCSGCGVGRDVVEAAGPKVVERPSRRFGSGRETFAQVRKWSGDPLKGPEVDGRPSWRSGSGQETTREVRKWS